MSVFPIICFGQQPCGIFPKRFFYSKIITAKRVQKQIGGKIIFFYHDSDSDFRETITVLQDHFTKAIVRINFEQDNKLQKKYSPLYLKRIPLWWKQNTAKRLYRFVEKPLIEMFLENSCGFVADFCLTMYEKMKLLNDISVMRSSDQTLRKNAMELEDYFADVDFEGEKVRAKYQLGKLFLHRGGGLYHYIKPDKITKEQVSPDKEKRFSWMQSVIHCTHYIIGESEMTYLDTKKYPEVTFIPREPVENPEMAWTG